MAKMLLTPYQVDAIKALVNKHNGILIMRPGRGKTAVVLGMSKVFVAKGARSIVILSHQKGCVAYTPEKIDPGFEVHVAMKAQDLVPLREAWEATEGNGVWVISTGLFNQWEKEWRGSGTLEEGSEPLETEDPLGGGAPVDLYEGPGPTTPTTPPSPPSKRTKATIITTSRTPSESILYRAIRSASVVFVDEIHNYRDPSSATAEALHGCLRGLTCRIYGVTATLFYKSPEDIYWIFSYVFGSLLGNYKRYKEMFFDIRSRQSQAYRWVSTPTGRKKLLVPTVLDEVVGYKNLDYLHELVAPFIYEDKGSEFDCTVKVHTYGLSDEQAYLDIVKGLDMAQAAVLNLAGPRSTFKVTYFKGESVIVRDQAGNTFEADPADAQVGWDVYRDLKDGPDWCSVTKVSTALTESDIITRLVPLARYLSGTEDKRQTLFSVLDTIAEDHGCAIYCYYRDSIDELGDAVAARYGARRVVVIKGGEPDIEETMAGLGPTDFVLISSVALQSLDFFYDSLVIYEAVTNPGPFEQLVGRITRMNSPFRAVTFHFIVGYKTIEHYFYERLLRLVDYNVFSNAPTLEHIPCKEFNFEAKGASLRILKDVLLWRKAYGANTLRAKQ